jgi:uncharacterized membrane protein
MPITVHQFASNSADGSTIAVAFLLTAFFFRLLATSMATGRAIAVLYSLAAWLTLSKFPYAGLTFFYLAVPPVRFGGLRRYLIVGVGLCTLVLSLGFGLTQAQRYAPDRLTPLSDRGVSIRHQLGFLRAHPDRFAVIYASTVAEVGPTMITELGQLGWLDTPVNPLAMQGYFLLLLVVGLGDRLDGWQPSKIAHAAGLGAAVASSAAILMAVYVAGVPVGSKLVQGIQGRYFVPLLPVLLLPLYNRWARLQIDRAALLGLTIGGCTATLLVAAAGFVRRYYLPVEWQLYTAPLSLFVGLLVLAIIIAAVHRLPFSRREGRSERTKPRRVARSLAMSRTFSID